MKNNNFDRKKIKDNTWKIAFKKGTYAWLLLVAVCFIFSFVGISNAEQTSFISFSDSFLGLNTAHNSKSLAIIKEYIINNSIAKGLSFRVVNNVVDFALKNHAWVVNLLAYNLGYFERNLGEVFVSILIVSVISSLIKIFLQNAFIVGKARYTMENRFNKHVEIKRIFAPFHKRNILNIIWVVFSYQLSLFFWAFTIVGYFYKSYQYKMIPYLLAENPNLTWKQAKEMSIKMTDGYKWKMFKTSLSCIHIYIIKVIPFVGLLFALPFEETLNAEFYFYLREKIKNDEKIFIEKSFNTASYPEAKHQEYLMKDVILTPAEIRQNIKTDIKRNNNHYNIYDYIFFFFTFCIIGYLWEVLLIYSETHVLANRGTMYGPWLPIYGFGGVFILLLLDRFKTNKFKLFFSAVGLCATLEYLCSWFLEFFYNSSYWNYSNEFLNINGRVCFIGLTAFGLCGMLAVYVVAPRLSLFLDKIGIKKTRIICAILIALFIIDLICCLIFGLNSGNGVGGNFNIYTGNC